jgi:RNA polymerase sigma factor (sigma-70 family)
MKQMIIQGNQNTTKLITELKKAETQYPTLSKEEEEQMISKWKNNRSHLNKLLFMHNIRIVFSVAKRYTSKTDDFDAMVQDGMLGLAIAAQKFDVDRGTKFITYATPWVRKKVLERFYSKANNVIKNSISLNAPQMESNSKTSDDLPDFENYVHDYIDTTVCPEFGIREQIALNEQAQLCADLYTDLDNDAELQEHEKSIFIDMFYNHERAKDIQRKYNITTKDMTAIKSKILSKMRKTLEDKYSIESFMDII